MMGIPRGASRRRKYFIDQFEPLWLMHGHELSEEEQLLLNLGFGISGEVLTYTEIARHLNFSNPSHAGHLIEHALKNLRRAAQNSRQEL